MAEIPPNLRFVAIRHGGRSGASFRVFWEPQTKKVYVLREKESMEKLEDTGAVSSGALAASTAETVLSER